MGRKELVDHIKGSFATRADAERAVDSVVDGINTLVQAGEQVQLRGFGTFSLKRRGERPGRDFRTNEPVTIAARDYVHFKPTPPQR